MTSLLKITPTIIVHGGAYDISDEFAEPSRVGCEQAAAVGLAVLQAGGNAIDAVEAAIQCLEDNPTFDAGIGSLLTSNGTVEMDSMIMRGDTLNSGAVACISKVRHPISAARAVLEKSPHVLLVGTGADAFAKSQGLEQATAEQLITETARKEYEQYKQYGDCVSNVFASGGNEHDTVGCVVVDSNGLFASGTSTGGITAKLPGRVGDSPIVGSGGIADNELGCVSTTGHGESILKVGLARRVLNVYANAKRNTTAGTDTAITLQEAAEQALKYMHSRVGGHGGLISIASDGAVGIAFSTKRMCWCHKNVDGLSESGCE